MPGYASAYSVGQPLAAVNAHPLEVRQLDAVQPRPASRSRTKISGVARIIGLPKIKGMAMTRPRVSIQGLLGGARVGCEVPGIVNY